MRVNAILNIYDLTEANILNIKDEYGGVSIAGYLKTFADNLPVQLQKPFYKKIAALLINDERFHYAVRDVPDTAPDWAKQAVAKQELFAFRPSEDLNELLQHITHYLAAAADDAVKSPSPDQKIVAQRELDAFPKAENLDTIKKKSDVFFTRGSQKAGRETTGMEKAFDAGEGYIWYKLVDEEAFRREGKALQNCIGSIYTAARMAKDKEVIVVLKNPSNESVVAARIDVAKKELIEVKGKNNKPPIEKYMYPTIKFVNHMKLQPGYGALYDLQNAGFYYDKVKTEILTKTEAIKRFIQTTLIAKVGQGLSLVQAKINNWELYEQLYANTLSKAHRSFFANRKYGEEETKYPDIYELRDGSNIPVVTGIAGSKRLLSVNVHSGLTGVQEAAEALDTSSKSLLLVTELLKRGLVIGLDKGIQQQILWQQRLHWDEKTKKFIPIKTKETDIDTDKTHMKWKVYKDPAVVKQLFMSLQTSDTDNDEEMLGGYKADDIAQIYIDKHTDKEQDADDAVAGEVTYMILRTKDGVALPIRALYKEGKGSVLDKNAGYEGITAHSPGDRNDRVVNSLMGLANKEKLALPKTVRLSHGIVRPKGHYERFEPKFEKVEGKQKAIKLDVSNLSPGDRLASLMYVATTEKYVGPPGPRYNGLGSDLLTISNAIGRSETKVMTDTSLWMKGELHAIYKRLFRGATPETVYIVEITYGADKKARTTLLVDGTKIIRVDSNTSSEKWQKWADYDEVAEQLNQFAAEHGLRFEPSALVGLESSKVTAAAHQSELRIGDGKVTTAASEKSKTIEDLRKKGHYQTEGTDDLTFDDGAKLIRMDPAKQARWVREKMHGEGGRAEAWEIYDKDKKLRSIITVDRGNLMSMYGPRNPDAQSTEINERGLVGSVLPYVKKAAEIFGWKTTNSRLLQIKPGSRMHDSLKMYDQYGARRRRYLRDAERILLALKLISRESGGTRSYRIASNLQGTAALKKLNGGDNVSVLGNITGAEVPKDFQAPTRREKPKKVRASAGTGKWKVSTAAPRAGSKADLALEKFKEIAATGDLPTRGQFMQTLMQPPFNMSKSGAQTYYYTTKAKYGALGESLSVLALQQLREDPVLLSFKRFLIW